MNNMPSASARIYVYALGLTIAFCAGAWVGYQPGAVRAERAERALAMAQRDAAQQVAISEAKAREAERRAVERIAEIEAKHASELGRIESEVETLVSDLRAGNLRLRQHWQASIATCELSGSAAAALHAEQQAQLRAESAARIVRLGAEADAQIRALQEAYEALRRPAP